MKKLSTFLSLAIAATILSGCYVSPYAYNRGYQCPPPELPPIKVELSPLKIDTLPVKVEVEKKKPEAPECPSCNPCRPACPY